MFMNILIHADSLLKIMLLILKVKRMTWVPSARTKTFSAQATLPTV